MTDAVSKTVHLQPRRSLTPAQELIWTSQRLEPGSPHQNMALITRFGAPIDPERFLAAVDSVLSQSDALRTTIREIDGVPHPFVSTDIPASCEVVRVDAEHLEEWMTERLSRTFDLARAAYDMVLIDLGNGEWAWWANVHHIVIDAASSANLFTAVASIYHDIDVSIPNYEGVWSELVAAQDPKRIQTAADSWAMLSEPAPTLFYRPESAPGTNAERRSIDMSSGRQAALDALLADQFQMLSPDLSLSVALATALAAYLARMGNDSVTIGIPIHHRSTKGSKDAIGPFIEMFPLQAEVRKDDTFITLHKRIGRTFFELLSSALPGTSPRQQFDVVLNVHAATFGDFGEIPASTQWIHPGHVDPHHRFRLQALDYDGSGTLDLALDINHSIADSGHRQRADGHFAMVLDAMLDDPNSEIGRVSLVGQAELALLSSFTKPTAGVQINGTAPEVVATQLRAYGVTPTIEHNDPELGQVQLTARNVDELIDRVAGTLRQAGYGRGDLIAIEMPIGIDAVLAIHGVQRAGAAFVPIDPTYPAARREHIRSDSGAKLVITELAELDRLPVVDRQPSPVTVEPDDLAYVIYTSGSTGLPKGVPITHRGLSEYLGFAYTAYVAAFEDEQQLSMPLFTSLSFDLTITTLFLPLICGGLMTVHPEGGLPALREIVEQRKVNMLKATPSHLELLARMIDDSHPLRRLIVGGEAFMTDLADRLQDVLGPDLVQFNEYGPTEAVVGCMVHRYDAASDPGPEVPIGRPAPGVGLHVLDRVGFPVPLGVTGELFVSRPGMTAGYLGRGDLNAQKFLPRSGAEGVLYRTGDLVRMLDADRMVYLGRIDEQIKVGGVRLEPGEIEHVAQKVPGVTRAVAGLWTADPDQRVEHCIRCGLSSEVPDTVIDDDGVCSSCHHFDLVAPQAEAWFKTEDDLAAELAVARERSTGFYDVVHLISGGKDSTYALYKLVEMGARVYAITLDNGYIADVAKANVRRATEALGVDHEFVTIDGMDEIFRDSLERFSNVCNGCYKAIYTIALAKAEELGVASIVTGLSRGQFFETRLVPGMFDSERFDPEAIDEMVREARHVYHTTPDAVSEHMDVDFLSDETVLDRISFIDFYRYIDVELSELYRALDESGTWQRPPDSGRSTNCLINAAGIFVHKLEQGHHNYAAPYSWDVRLGHKTRDEVLHELDDPMDATELSAITSMLAKVGYEPRKPEVLTLWVQASDDLDIETLRNELANELPSHAVPGAIEIVDEIPLTANGKVDFSALPAPAARRVADAGAGRAPSGSTEDQIASIWESVLGIPDITATVDFFSLGGTSLHALEMIVRVSEKLDVVVPESLAFKKRTIAELAAHIDNEIIPSTPTDSVSVAEQLSIPSVGEHTELLPLSSGEEAMLYEWLRDPTDLRYNVARLYLLPEDLDVERFNDAVRLVVHHQPTLHTSYGPRRQKLEVSSALWFGDSSSEVASLTQLARHMNHTQFDLVNGRLITVHHLTSDHPDDRGRRGVLLRTHHIVSDAGSLDILWNQIDLAYQGQDLPKLDATYAAHSLWQRDRATDPVAAWNPQEPPAQLLLRGVNSEPDGYVHRVSSITNSQLRDAPATTAFANALTALSAAMRPYHDGDLLELTVTSSVRDHPDLANVVGYFLNPLPLLIDVDPDSTLSELAGSVSGVLANALEHRSVPFGSIVRSARDRGIAVPTGRVMLAVEDLAPASLDGDPVEHTILSSGTAVNDLTFFVQIRGERVELGVEYRGTTIGRESAEQLLDSFADSLELLVASADSPAGAAVVSPPALLGPQIDDIGSVVPALVARSIIGSPNAPAVTSGDRSLSYHELDAESRRLAARLRAVGVGPGDRVAIVLPRSVDLISAIGAIWMLGASYVPLDYSLPATRVTELISAAGVRAAVSTGEGHAGLNEVPTVHVDRDDVAVLPIARAATIAPAAEAYVIFTSGSTGTPKGVPITHGNLRASVAARRQWYKLSVDRYLMVSSAGFDSSVAGMFWTLADGGELIIPSEDQVHDVDALVDLVESHKISHTLMVPSLYGAMLQRAESVESQPLASLRTVIVAGEACPPALVNAHFTWLPSTKLINEYGPTEATVWSTVHRCERADGEALVVPIGKPIPGTAIEVVDEDGNAVPIGTAGELWVSGPGVANGYLSRGPVGQQDNSETLSSFLADRGTGTIYRTGDLVVRRRSGVLDFLGRVDSQLSVGGVRIEPAEIEQAISSIDGVSACLVGLDGRQLVAWVESVGLAGPELRTTAKELLPATHLPARIVVTERLPRNANGKLDRDRLDEITPATPKAGHGPAHAAGRPAAESESSATASDPVVKHVTKIFDAAFEGQALDGQAIGPDTDFFDAGGDSLRAVAVVAMLENSFGQRVPIGELIDAPTPRLLARRLPEAPLAGRAAEIEHAEDLADIVDAAEARIREAAGDDSLVEWLRSSGSQTPLVVLPPGGGNLLRYAPLVKALDADTPVVGVRLPGADARSEIADSISSQAQQMLDALDTAVSSGPYRLLGWSTGGLLAWEIARLLKHRGDEVELVVLVDTVMAGLKVDDTGSIATKYLDMVRNDGAKAAATEGASRLRERASFAIARRRYRAAREAGQTPTMEDAERQLGPVIRRAALNYRPRPLDLPIVYIGASESDNAVTVDPWTNLQDGKPFEVIEIEGVHFLPEAECIIGPNKAGDLVARLSEFME